MKNDPLYINQFWENLRAVGLSRYWKTHRIEYRDPLIGDTYWFQRSSEYLPKRSIYISAGIHGDEPAGPLACLDLLNDESFFAGWDVYMFPMLNASGFNNISRENHRGIDLNRDYKALNSEEVASHISILQRLPKFDVAICLHEDWEAEGVYLYHLNRSGLESRARVVLSELARQIPIDRSTVIDGHTADAGIITKTPDVLDRPDWPEALYLCSYHTDISFTLETPSSRELALRIEAHVAAVKQVCQLY
ncbi:MAG: M14 family metallocarboxypeptidase [Verrucomicrobiota bacterium]